MSSQHRPSISNIAPVIIIPLLDHKAEGELPDLPELRSILEHTSAKTLAVNPNNQSRELVTLTESTTIASVVGTLAQNNILSAPVLSDDGQRCLGVVDLIAIVEFVVNTVVVKHDQHVNAPSTTQSVNQNNLQAVQDQSAVETNKLVLTPAQIASSPIKRLIEQPFLAKGLKLHTFFEHQTIDFLTDWMSNPIHRVALINQSYELVTIASQSDLIHFLDQEVFSKQHCKTLAALKIDQLPLAKHREIVSINETLTVRQAVQTLIHQSVSSLAIIHSVNQSLVGDFSASALRGLTDFRRMQMNVIDYLQKYHSRSLTPQHARPNATLQSLINQLSKNRCHRVWILDEQSKVLDIVTATDICRLLSSKRQVTDMQANGGVEMNKLWVAHTPNIKMADPNSGDFSFEII